MFFMDKIIFPDVPAWIDSNKDITFVRKIFGASIVRGKYVTATSDIEPIRFVFYQRV